MILTYDTETTGFSARGKPLSHPLQPRIVQLGAILDDGKGQEMMRIDVIICHPDIPPEVSESWKKASEIHGISEEVANLVGIGQRNALNVFLDMVEVAEVIVGHNVIGYDNDIVRGSVRRAFDDETLDPFAGKKIFDTMQAGTPLCRLPSRQGGFKKPTLTELHKFLFNEGFDGAHTAISDVLASRRSFYRMQDIVREARAA